jgi:hypothetical protein
VTMTSTASNGSGAALAGVVMAPIMAHHHAAYEV